MPSMLEVKRKKIGLALGSGGARGLAHIGVIRVLEKHGIPMDFIAGSSIGAVVGGFYAATRDINWVEKVLTGNDRRQLFELFWDLAVFKGGLLKGDKGVKYFRDKLTEQTGKDEVLFKDLLLPFSAVATNLESGEAVVLRSGNLLGALRASYSIPFLFQPVLSEKKLLADGGLSQPVPVNVARSMGADIVIGVNLDAHFPKQNIEKVHMTSLAPPLLNIVRHNLASKDLQLADIKIEPKITNSSLLGIKHFLDAKEFISKGEEAMESEITNLKKLI